MNWGFIGLLAVFGIFIVLLVINPNLSCFGRRIKSPFYPLLRRSTLKKRQPLHPVGGPKTPTEKPAQDKRAEDYGFKLD